MAKKKKSKARLGGKKSQEPLRQAQNTEEQQQQQPPVEVATEETAPAVEEPVAVTSTTAHDEEPTVITQQEDEDSREDADGEDKHVELPEPETITVTEAQEEVTEEAPVVPEELHISDEEVEEHEESPSQDPTRNVGEPVEEPTESIALDALPEPDSEGADDELVPQSTEESHDLSTHENEDAVEGSSNDNQEKKDDANEATVEISKDEDEYDEEDHDYTKPLAESSSQFLGIPQDPEQTENESAFEEEVKPVVSYEENGTDDPEDTTQNAGEELPEPVAEAVSEPVSEPEPEVPQTQTEAQEEVQEEHTEKPSVNELLSSTEGPYTLSPLKLEIPPSMGTLSAFCHFENNIIVGTSLGYILSYTLLPSDSEPEYILTSQVQFHATRQFPVMTFLPLHTLQILLVVSGSLLQCFSLPTPTPLPIGRVKDVEAIELDLNGKAKCDENGVHVVVMTKSQLRVVNVTKQALRLVKDVKMATKCGKRRVDRMVVSHEGRYEILDINREINNRTELFHVNTMGDGADELKPFVQGVGKDEFLLVCGTGKKDPAMGLVVNNNGDVSRGTIPMMHYPDDVITDGDVAIVVSGGEVTTYSLEDQREVQSWKYSKSVKINKIDPMSVNSEHLVSMITLKAISGGNSTRDTKELEFARKISQVQSSIVCFCDDFIQRLVPQSRLERLQSVTKLRTLEKELASSLATTELTVIEVEYLHLHISLIRLLEHKYDEAIEGWTNGSLDPRILIHAFNYDVYGEVYMFAGLIPLIEKLKSSIKETAFKNFFEVFLERWLSKQSIENHDIITSLEMTMVLYYLSDHKQLLQTLRSVSLVDVIPILKSNDKHLALAHIYAETDPTKAIAIHKDLVDNKISDLEFDKDDSLHIICELGNKCADEERRETGMWLLKHDAKLAISFLNSSKLSLHSLQTGMNRTEEVKNVIESIDDIGLKYEYMSQVFVSMGQEKMKLGLKKGLYRSLLKNLTSTEKTMRANAQKS